MSSERSSSAVRNLRSIFENKAPDASPDTRGRSTSGLTSEAGGSRQTSRIRASFVSVEPSGGMASTTEEDGVGKGMASLKRESSAGLRRGSFSENDGDENLLDLKKTVSQEAERRDKDAKIAEPIPEHAAESMANTPNVKATQEQFDEAIEDSPLAHKEGAEEKRDVEPVNPDKPTMAAEEEPSEMKPADPASADAVSGGEALPPVAEDLRKTANGAEEKAEPEVQETPKVGHKEQEAPATKMPESAVKEVKEARTAAGKAPSSKPSTISTKAPAKATSSVKSPASQPKTPLSGKASSSTKIESPKAVTTREPAKKASRSSLTAPTAASVARTAGADSRSVSTSSKQSPPSKAKPRDTTKPIDLPSRLTAPTAASRAKHDTPSAPSSSHAVNGKSSTTARPKPATSSARPTPRSSLAPSQRPESRTSQVSKKTAAPTDGSFLERMMRPTAASASKTHDKVEVKSPPRASQSKPKTNGHLKKPVSAATKASSRPGTAKSGTENTSVPQAVEEPAPSAEEQAATQTAMDGPPPSHDGRPTGNETPLAHTNGDSEQSSGALEATPAFDGQEIR